MASNKIQNSLERLLNLDSRTRSLIASLEHMPVTISDLKAFREQLDTHQDEIKGNLTSMRNLLNELDQKRFNRPSSFGKFDLTQTLANSMQQLSFLQENYRKAIFRATRHLEAMEREDLLRHSDLERNDTIDDLNDAYEKSVELTRDMMAYARRLAEEVKLGAANAELLEDSSSLIGQNYTELKGMNSQMLQSRRLTSLAYRRRMISYILYSLAFAFYFFSVVMIFLKRVPMGSWLLPSSYL